MVPTFNNATLTNQSTIAETNNNLIKTPSTSDPVSTVTFNYDPMDRRIAKSDSGANRANHGNAHQKVHVERKILERDPTSLERAETTGGNGQQG